MGFTEFAMALYCALAFLVGCIGVVIVRQVPDTHRPLGRGLWVFGVIAAVVGFGAAAGIAYLAWRHLQ